ncbi:MAG: DUF5305 family protein, partial [Nitrososphaerales archaeon]
TQKPPETNTVIEVKSLEDLAKIADKMNKPILYLRDEDHNFYVIDDKITYLFKNRSLNTMRI